MVAGQVQSQRIEFQLTEAAVDTHAQAQIQPGPFALAFVFQVSELQWHDIGGIACTELATLTVDGSALHGGIPSHPNAWAGAFQRVELQDAEGRYRPHVMGPEQVHQRVRQLRQFVIQLLTQAPGQECKALQQALDIRVLARFAEKRRQGGITFGKTSPQLAQRTEFALKITVKRHWHRPQPARYP